MATRRGKSRRSSKHTNTRDIVDLGIADFVAVKHMAVTIT